MGHGRIVERQAVPAQVERLALGDDLELPRRRVEVGCQRGAALAVANDGCRRMGPQNFGHRPRMVQLGMVDDHVIQPGGRGSGVRVVLAEHRGHVLQQRVGKLRLDRIHQGGAGVADEVGVVARAAGRIEAVEVADRPVDRADPEDVRTQRVVHGFSWECEIVGWDDGHHAQHGRRAPSLF